MPLQVDYRPKTFDEIVGNKATVASLRAIFERESDWPHAVLFQGPPGCGKTTLARIVVGLLGCEGNDFVEINSSNDRGIGTARAIMEGARYRPMMGKTRVYLLDEIHMTTADFQNAMLKLLEDAPAHAYFLLCTTDPSRLIPALRSRCHTFELQYLSDREVMNLLQDTLGKENVKAGADIRLSLDILKQIADASNGCPRDALKILDQVIDMKPDQMSEAIVSFTYSEKQAVNLYNALWRQESWKRIVEVLREMDLSNPEGPRRAVIGLAGAGMLKDGDPKKAALIFDAFKEPLYSTGKPGFVMSAYRAMLDLVDVVPF